ncbi:MAG TPA: Crp/Fnr family transcriptional regulator [Planctomycetaceae bacterium]|jgi:CRP-like cAMP-binding protein|nr:Crp/Fnr family transcriptional regulator [Planctomycetaceae bacterium]
MDEKFWYLKNCSLFECLSDEHVRRLETRAKARTFKRGALVYIPSDQGDCVLLLIAGRVKIFHNTHDGKQAVLAIIDPGELFGELAIATLEEGQREEYAETMEASTIVLIPADDIRRLAAEQPSLSVGITKLMGLSRRRVERRLKSLLFRSNRERLVHLLFDLAEKYGRYTKEGGISLGIHLSHQELASIIGSTRETVTLVLGDLQAEGAISINRRDLVLCQVGRLAEMIEMPVPKIKLSKEFRKQVLSQPQGGGT